MAMLLPKIYIALNFYLLFLLPNSFALEETTSEPISKDCQIKLAVGALASLSGQEYKTLKNEFYQCTDLYRATMDIEDIDFQQDRNQLNPMVLQHNLREISKIFQKITPAFQKCQFKSLSKEEQIQISEILGIFADPDSSQIYQLTLNTVQNWSQVEPEADWAIKELNAGRCARSGFLIGKIMRKVFEDDATLSQVLYTGASKFIEDGIAMGAQVGEAVGKQFNKFKNMFTDL